MADAAAILAGVMCGVAVAPLAILSEAPPLRRLAPIVLGFLAGRCFNAALDGSSEWALAGIASVFAAASIANYASWRRER